MELDSLVRIYAAKSSSVNLSKNEIANESEKILAIEESFLIVISPEMSVVFQSIIWPVIIVGLIGNIAVLFRIFSSSSKQSLMLKPCYRCALFSFALSDLMLIITSGMNTLSIVTSRTIIWIYPDWTCFTIPYLQTVAILLGSLTLAGVAIDRYIAIKPKYPRPQPRIRKWICPIFFVLFTWCSAAAASYLILEIYYPEPIFVIKGDTYYVTKVCLMKDRQKVSFVMTALFVIIFLPLTLIFIIIHILLAINIWQREKLDYNPELSANSKDLRVTTVSYIGKHQKTAKNVSQRTLQKSRIIRIILILIVVFGACRLPLWVFTLCKFHTEMKSYYWWYLQISLTTMSFFNAAINPFLYAFLNEFLSFVTFCRIKFRYQKTNESTDTNVQLQIYKESNASCKKIPREAIVLC